MRMRHGGDDGGDGDDDDSDPKIPIASKEDEESFVNIFEFMEKEKQENHHDDGEKYYQNNHNHVETNVLFVGEKDSGKTSLINLFLGRKGE